MHIYIAKVELIKWPSPTPRNLIHINCYLP
jgi:hypothetical protein